MKYGALADGGGRLVVSWSTRDADGAGRRLVVEWVEQTERRPTHSPDPARIGYGRQLIERALPYQLGAKTSYALDDRGVRCMIDLPLEEARPRRQR